ncbi:hypothetical protein ACLB1O_04475 [Escherichia coli]
MHPACRYGLGGVAHDLPRGWDRLLREFLDSMRNVWRLTRKRRCKIPF